MSGKIDRKDVPGYIIAQILGGIFAAGILLIIVKGLQGGYDPSVAGFAANGYGEHSPGKFMSSDRLIGVQGPWHGLSRNYHSGGGARFGKRSGRKKSRSATSRAQVVNLIKMQIFHSRYVSAIDLSILATLGYMNQKVMESAYRIWDNRSPSAS